MSRSTWGVSAAPVVWTVLLFASGVAYGSMSTAPIVNFNHTNFYKGTSGGGGVRGSPSGSCGQWHNVTHSPHFQLLNGKFGGNLSVGVVACGASMGEYMVDEAFGIWGLSFRVPTNGTYVFSSNWSLASLAASWAISYPAGTNSTTTGLIVDGILSLAVIITDSSGSFIGGKRVFLAHTLNYTTQGTQSIASNHPSHRYLGGVAVRLTAGALYAFDAYFSLRLLAQASASTPAGASASASISFAGQLISISLR